MNTQELRNQTIGVEIEGTGITREQAAKAVAEFFGTTSRYDGGAYCTYTVKDSQNREWRFQRDSSISCYRKENGRLTSADSNYSVEVVTPILTYDDIPTLQEIVRVLRKKGMVSGAKYRAGVHIHIGKGNHTAKTLSNLINLMASKEDLIYEALEVDYSRAHYCKKMNNSLIERINRRKPTTMRELADIWYDAHDTNYNRNGHYNDSRYHCLNLHSTFTKGTIEFRLFNFDGKLHAGKLRAWIVMCLAMSNQALNQTSARAKKSENTNKKFVMRTWLCRMGLSGDEFKNCREHLTAKLSGNSAWSRLG